MKSMGDLLKRAIGQSEKLPPKYWTEGWNKFSFSSFYLLVLDTEKSRRQLWHLFIP